MTAGPVRELAYDREQLILEAELPGIEPDEAYRWFTEPALLCRWWCQQAETDPREGGAYHLAWPVMGWNLRGEYRVCEPPELPPSTEVLSASSSAKRYGPNARRGTQGRLAFSWRWDHEPDLPTREVGITFSPGPKGTRIVIQHGPYALSETEVADRKSHLEGWVHFIGKLAEQTT